MIQALWFLVPFGAYLRTMTGTFLADDSPDAWERVNLGSPWPDATSCLAIGDLTGDGLPDVVVGNYAEQNYVLVNNGGSPDTWSRVK